MRAIDGLDGVAYLDPSSLVKDLSYVFGPVINNLMDAGYTKLNLQAAPVRPLVRDDDDDGNHDDDDDDDDDVGECSTTGVCRRPCCRRETTTFSALAS